MVLVKLTALLIILTLIFRYVAGALISSEDYVTQYQIRNGVKITWYTITFAIMIILSVIGIIYSAIYLLFLR